LKGSVPRIFRDRPGGRPNVAAIEDLAVGADEWLAVRAAGIGALLSGPARLDLFDAGSQNEVNWESSGRRQHLHRSKPSHCGLPGQN
jgi:hypothetical protein